MFCRNCGKQLMDGALFCTECGCKASEKTEVDPTGAVVSNKADQNMAGTVMHDSGMQGNELQDPHGQVQRMGNPRIQGQNNVPPIRTAGQGGISANGRPMNARAKKKGNTVAIVLAAVFGTMFLGFIAVLVFVFYIAGTSADTDAEDKMTTQEADVMEKVTGSADVADPGAVEQLLKILNETLEATDSIGNGADDTDDMKAMIEEYNRIYKEIEDQYRRSQEIEGLPENFRKASSDAYEMFLSGIESTNKDYVFIQDILELNDTINPDDLTATYYAFKDKHEKTVCPENMEDSWKAIGKSLDFLAESVNRNIEGEELGDALRMFSSDNHLIRFASVFENEMYKIRDSYKAEQEFLFEQGSASAAIINEIVKASALEPEEMGKYEFEYYVENVIKKVTYDHILNIYPSLYNTYDSFVTVKMGCLKGSREVIIECEIPGLSQSISQSYHIGPAMKAIKLKPPASSEKLDLNTAKDTQIKVTVKDKSDGMVLDTQSFPVHIYSRNDFEWDSDAFGTITKDNILCFLSPDSEAITKLKRNAIDILEDMSGGEMNTLAGYQGPYFTEDTDGDGNADNLGQARYLTTYLQAAALMRSMSDMGVRYTNDTFSIDNAGQHILFPDQVLERKTGLCIETSLVIASALQSMGMHTYLIFPPGHAQVALETWEGSGNYLLIETTALPNKNSDFIDEANSILTNWERESDDYPIACLTKEDWVAYLTADQGDFDDDCYVLDCGDGALLGMTPFAN